MEPSSAWARPVDSRQYLKCTAQFGWQYWTGRDTYGPLKIRSRPGHDQLRSEKVLVGCVWLHLFMPTVMLTSLAAQTARHSAKQRLLPKQCDFVGCALNMLKLKKAVIERRESFQCECCKPLPDREFSLSWPSCLSFRFSQKNSVCILRFPYTQHARPVSPSWPGDPLVVMIIMDVLLFIRT